MHNKLLTLCMVTEKNRILLGMKKRGFGAGRWNGFGGKVHEGETIAEAAQRELMEEAGIHSNQLDDRGTLLFHFENEPQALEVHLFSTTSFTGEPSESDEMKPHWFTFDTIPYDAMWPDDIYWLPIMLEGKNIHGEFFFKDTNTLLDHQIEVLEKKKDQ